MKRDLIASRRRGSAKWRQETFPVLMHNIVLPFKFALGEVWAETDDHGGLARLPVLLAYKACVLSQHDPARARFPTITNIIGL